MWVKGIPSRVITEKNEKTVRKEKIHLRAIDEVLREIKVKYETSKIVVKIDCEGSEYDIVRSLNEKSLLADLDFIMIEWHIDGPDELIWLLNKSRFSCFSFNSHRKDVGMIYAVRNR